jgi:hypothetical protein
MSPKVTRVQPFIDREPARSHRLPHYRCRRGSHRSTVHRSARHLAGGDVDQIHTEQLRRRHHDAVHRGGTKATEEELAEITVVVLAVVAEVATELAEVIGELGARIEALEAR